MAPGKTDSAKIREEITDSLTLMCLKSRELKKSTAVCAETSEPKITFKLHITLENTLLIEINLLN